MLSFIENHQYFIFTILPSCFHNKFVIAIFSIIFFVGVIKLANMLMNKFINKLYANKNDFEAKKELFTLKSLIMSIFNTVVIAFAVIYVFNILGVDIRPILTAAGVLGVAVGFGAKRFFEDIISGFTIILEGQVRVGDYVEIGSHQGVVEKVDIKLIQLRDISGRVHYVRNGMIDTIINYTREYSYYLFDIGVSYSSDIDKVMDALKQVDQEFRNLHQFRYDVLEPLEIMGVEKFDDSAIIIRSRLKTKPIKQWEIGRAFNKEIKKKFDELGIEIPFPQRTLHIADGKIKK
ncbi:MAG: mechanosensitive ion channel family protein [Candidatus Gastranaerophilales bacterium]